MPKVAVSNLFPIAHSREEIEGSHLALELKLATIERIPSQVLSAACASLIAAHITATLEKEDYDAAVDLAANQIHKQLASIQKGRALFND